MSWITPIFNRTQADVLRAAALAGKRWADMTSEERAEWETDLKGALNLSDLFRIDSDINVILTLYPELGLTPRTPTMDMIFVTREYWETLHGYIQAIREGCLVYADTPATPPAVLSTFEAINSAEKILFDVYTIWQSNASAKRYTGEVICSTAAIDLI